MKKLYNISVGQLITLWIFGAFGWIISLESNGFLLWIIPLVLVFYTIGWRNLRTQTNHSAQSDVKIDTANEVVKNVEYSNIDFRKKDFDQNSHGPKILWFEDDLFLLRMYGVKFSKSGFNMATRDNANADDDNGNIADFVYRMKPDLLITGIVMPGRDGLTAIELLRGDPRTEKLPVVVLSNQGSTKDVDKATRLRVLMYIVKAEVIPSDVVKRIRDLLVSLKIAV